MRSPSLFMSSFQRAAPPPAFDGGHIADPDEAALAAFRHTVEQAQRERRGLTLFIAGEAIRGTGVRLVNRNLVEVHSPQLGRILLRLDRIDGMATNAA